MNKRLITLLSSALLFVSGVYAQTTGLEQSQTNASSGIISQSSTAPGKDIYSTNLFTGTVDVNIPIYSYTVDGVNLGISLSYNTGGIKVDQVASNVGLGWSLNTGGMITREVMGVEDEAVFRGIDSNGVQAVGPISGLWTYGGGEDPPDIFNAVIGGKSIKFTLSGYSAPSPTFTVSLQPKKDVTVELILDHTPIYYLNSFHKLPSNIADDRTVQILRFRIIDEQGNIFFFDRGDVQQRNYTFKDFHPPYYSVSNTGEAYYFVPTSWHLSKVVTYSGTETKYYYAYDYYDYPGYNDQRVAEASSYTDNLGGTHDGGMSVINNVVQMEQHTKQLTQIIYPNGDILKFNTDGNLRKDVNGTMALSSITVEKEYDATVKNMYTYKFNYAYFYSHGADLPYPTNSGSSPLYRERLKLNSIDKIGTDNTTTERYYTFDYHATKLPQRLSASTDCYGYYNGKAAVAASTTTGTFNSSALSFLNIPAHSFTFFQGVTLNVVNYGRDMTPDWTYAQAGLLTSVTNGMGGVTNFYYKNHSLSNPPDFNSPATYTGYFDIYDVRSINGPATGTLTYSPPPASELYYQNANDGVCIDHITTSDGISPDNYTNTIYTFSNGMRFFVGGYFWTPNFIKADIAKVYTDHWHPIGDNINDIIQNVYQGTFVNPIDYVNGCNHGYSNVNVLTTGYAGEIVSNRAYEFTNVQAKTGEEMDGFDLGGHGSRLQLMYGKFSHTFHRLHFQKHYLGLLKKEYELDDLGNILSETSNIYNEKRYPDSIHWVREQFSCKFNQIGLASPAYGNGAWTSPKINQFSYYPSSVITLKKSTTTNHSGADQIQLMKDYAYDVDNDLLTTTYTNSVGQAITEINDYTYLPVQTFVSGTLIHTKGAKFLQATGTKLGTLYTSYNMMRIQPAPAPFSRHIYDGVGDPLTHGGYNIMSIAGPQGNMRYQENFVFKGTAPTSALTFYLAKNYRKSDDHGNVIEVGYFNDTRISSAIWDNRIAEKVAQVTNALHDDIAYSSFEGVFNTGADYNKGNWDFDPTYVVTGTPTSMPVTGRYYYDLPSTGLISQNAMTTGKKYFVSFWYKGPRPLVVSAIYTAVTLTDQVTVGGWTLATGTFTGSGGTLAISSASSCYLDEARIYPFDATMETFTYEPLLGISSRCDERNNIVYYEYDKMGRQTIARDINRNIISLTKQIVQGTD